ncbi:putative phage abortive infection protein [Sinorhizobium medicae]|uniref:putative phage abortive infection protein n=1 Tax=Sinorhizobium medicae TaxID=110321 RepID=UPI001F18C2C2|nr:putative phage abortive infection protein [Sinorhizobium medicae]
MKTRWVMIPAALVTLTWAAWVAQAWLLPKLGVSWDVPKFGQWGDTFGALNALFSALAFVAVLFTLKQQRDDLARQQTQILKAEQNQHRQRFEDNFFQLLAVIRENREDVRFGYSKNYLALHDVTSRRRQGHLAFQAAHGEMLYWVQEENRAGTNLDCEALAALYAKKIHLRFESTLGAYFRLVYETLDRVDRDQFLSDDEKDEFGNLVRGQMTASRQPSRDATHSMISRRTSNGLSFDFAC